MHNIANIDGDNDIDGDNHRDSDKYKDKYQFMTSNHLPKLLSQTGRRSHRPQHPLIL